MPECVYVLEVEKRRYGERHRYLSRVSLSSLSCHFLIGNSLYSFQDREHRPVVGRLDLSPTFIMSIAVVRIGGRFRKSQRILTI